VELFVVAVWLTWICLSVVPSPDTKYASNFVLRAIECSPGCFSSESQRCAQVLLDEIFSGNVVTHA
jgi:hypothetical protein